jgi:hypothetical protein
MRCAQCAQLLGRHGRVQDCRHCARSHGGAGVSSGGRTLPARDSQSVTRRSPERDHGQQESQGTQVCHRSADLDAVDAAWRPSEVCPAAGEPILGPSAAHGLVGPTRERVSVGDGHQSRWGQRQWMHRHLWHRHHSVSTVCHGLNGHCHCGRGPVRCSFRHMPQLARHTTAGRTTAGSTQKPWSS